jgi:adenylosuccinate lyase
MTSFDFDTYLSPFSWRYGSSEMRDIFSEKHKYQIWRQIWIALATAQHSAGLISNEELADLKKHQKEIDIDRALEIEKQTHHDVVAAIREFAEKANVGGGKIHLGATSMDIVDNADSLKVSEGLLLIQQKVRTLLQSFSHLIDKRAEQPCMAYTHLQPAEPTTIGYRFALYAQDLLIDYKFLNFILEIYSAKGMKGAVGTAASYSQILQDTKLTPEKMEALVMKELGLQSVLISSQVSPRKFDYLVVTALASISSSLAKFAADIRLLQSPGIGEWAEGFGSGQVGSSAMPFKKNQINSEKICSLARFVTQLPAVALENATHSYLERTLDDSANKRVVIAEAFLATDEVLQTAQKLLKGLVINDHRVLKNLEQYAPFAATESILIELVKKGADRQAMHEKLKEISLAAWAAIQEGNSNPMPHLLISDKVLNTYLSPKEIGRFLDVTKHIGTAPQRAKELVKVIRKEI